jgi:hypothetical protein
VAYCLTNSNGLLRLSRLGDILHIEKSGHFTVDVVLKSLFMIAGKSSDDISNRLDMKVTVILSLRDKNRLIEKFRPCITGHCI